MTNFKKAFTYLMTNEGTGYTNDPRDAGGPTKFGITLKSYQNFIKACIGPEVIENLTMTDAQNFYFKVYWEELCLDEFSHIETQVCIFDSAVLYGPATAIVLAQKAASICGATLKFDGLVGDKTIEAINLIKPDAFVKAFHTMILTRINTVVSVNPRNQVFMKGWVNRADRLLKIV